jgi:hypothetical protein
MADTGWFKSSYSGSANNTCVEVRLSELFVGVRDSKGGPGALHFPPAHWRQFLSHSVIDAS